MIYTRRQYAAIHFGELTRTLCIVWTALPHKDILYSKFGNCEYCKNFFLIFQQMLP